MSQKKQVLVIGGGLGGVSAAITLAQLGYEVALYEKNQHIGGKLNLLRKDGFTFDLGPSILTMPHIFQRLFERSGKKMSDYVKIQRLDLEWRSFFTDGTVLDLYGDLTQMAEANPGLTERDMHDYRRFLQYAGKLYEATEKGYFEQGFDSTLDVLRYHGPITALKAYDYFSTMYDAIDRYIHHPQLKDKLAYFIKYVGSSPYDAPAVLNMMAYMQHQQGVWYIPGGMNRLGHALEKLAVECGVRIHKGCEVISLDRSQDKITGAVLETGETVPADLFVSNMEVIPAHKTLLQADNHVLTKLNKFEPACSGLVLHLGVAKQYPQLAHHNFFFSDNPRQHFGTVFHKHQLPDDPTLYVVNVNKTDPLQAKPGHENLKILPHIPYIQNPPFTQADYRALRERVLSKLEKMGLVDLRQHIVTEDMWVPDDIQKTYYSDRGAIYGVVSDKRANHGFKHAKKSRYYKNLYFTGGTVNPGGGMPMVTLCGQQVARQVKKDDKL